VAVDLEQEVRSKTAWKKKRPCEGACERQVQETQTWAEEKPVNPEKVLELMAGKY
jgi:hypothetical protein